MRAREFVMKDAYSFHIDQASLETTYADMAEAYSRIFTRLGLRFMPVEADSGEIGGSRSQEFHVLADSGEDAIAFCEAEGFAANVEMAPAPAPAGPRAEPSAELAQVATPTAKRSKRWRPFSTRIRRSAWKTLIVSGEQDSLVALVLRGDHELNPVKAEKLPGVAAPLQMATPEQVEACAGCQPGFVGPRGLDIRIYADHGAAHAADFVCGANAADQHLTGVNWGRDLARTGGRRPAQCGGRRYGARWRHAVDCPGS